MDDKSSLESVFPRSIETNDITPAISHMFGTSDFVLNSWHLQGQLMGLGAGSAVYRLAGWIERGSRSEPWSMILKTVRPVEAGSAISLLGRVPHGWGLHPAHSHYWRRESLLYLSGVVEDLGPTLDTPKLLAVTQHAGPEAVWLWMEDLSDQSSVWGEIQCVRVAEYLGHLGARYAHSPDLSHPWLTRCFVRHYSSERCFNTLALAQTSSTWEHPAVLGVLGARAARLRLLFARRELLLSALEALPTTLVHFDAHQGNIFFKNNDLSAISLIDWSYVGLGAIGEDLAPAFGLTWLLFRPNMDAAAMGEMMFDSYVGGLRAAGYRPDIVVVRRAYALCAALYVMILAFPITSVINTTTARFPTEERDQRLDRYLARLPFIDYLLDLAFEAMAKLGI